MKYILTLTALLCTIAVFSQNNQYVLIIHGGAGNFDSSSFSEQMKRDYELGLQKVLELGDSLLKGGTSAMDVVVRCIVLLEDNPLFNAGKGAVMTEAGKWELDASVMDGKTMKAGAVAGISCIKNPILAALKVMEDGKHVMLAGKGAEEFSILSGLETADSSWFYVEGIYERYLKLKKQDKGTVGAVVLDKYGNLAAGTSTGGMMMKRYGRIGDAPIIGAGTYADNNFCAVSCTGHGEYFIRFVAAYDVCALMKYSKLSLFVAAQTVIDKIAEAGGSGGLIAVDKNGNIAMPFSTTSMFRAYIKENGEKEILF
jgi:L-asparaginase / beta-aspartyl-peptidase